MDMATIPMLEPAMADPAPQWLLAAMPDADVYLLREGRMHPLDGHCVLGLSPQLLNRVDTQGRTGDILVAKDADSGYWRLRHIAAPDNLCIWRIQSLHDSRERLRDRLRTALAPRVADHVLHDLRNPMNALSLNVDLVTQILTLGSGTTESTRVTSSLRIIKDRLRDLQTLQNHMVALWLSAPSDIPTTAGQVIKDTLRQLRGLLMLSQTRLDIDDLGFLDTCAITAESSASLQFVLIAILLMAITPAGEAEMAASALRLSTYEEKLSSGTAHVVLDIQAQFQSASIETCLDAEDVIGVFAALALLLDEYGIDIVLVPTGAHMKFRR